MLIIKWRSGRSKGYADLYPSRWFERDVDWPRRDHDVKSPNGGFKSARCAAHIKGDVAEFDYREHASFNKPSHYIGILRIVFTDAQRTAVKEVLWRQEGTDVFVIEDVDALDQEVPLEGLESFDPTDTEDGRDRIARMVVLRRGQAAFRKELMVAYEGRCAITGCEVRQVLEAAHIMPYLGEQTNHVRNGLLLRADIHTLFDLGLIKIDQEYRILTDPSIIEAFGLPAKIANLPRSKAQHPDPDALEEKSRTLILPIE